MFDSLLGIVGLTGLAGMATLAVLAIVGGPTIPVLAKVTESVLVPVATAVGGAISSIIKLQIDGAIDVLQTGQRILFVVTCCACTWGYTHHTVWKEVHAGYTLLKKQPAKAPVKAPPAKHRR